MGKIADFSRVFLIFRLLLKLAQSAFNIYKYRGWRRRCKRFHFCNPLYSSTDDSMADIEKFANDK